MNEPIVMRGGVTMTPAEVAEKEVLMPSINSAIVASQQVTR